MTTRPDLLGRGEGLPMVRSPTCPAHGASRTPSMTFFWNIVSSVVASVIVILAAGLLSRTARTMLIGALGRLVDIDVETVFRNPREAAPDVQRELERASRVDRLTGRPTAKRRSPASTRRSAAAYWRDRSTAPSRSWPKRSSRVW